MRYPKLVPEKLCKIDIVLEFEQEGLSEYGEPLPANFMDREMQLSGQGKGNLHCGEKDSADHRDSPARCGSLSGASGHILWHSYCHGGETAHCTGEKGQESGWHSELCGGAADMIKVKSSVKLNMPQIQQLTQAQVTALEQTAEALHTEVVQAQVFPFDTGNLQNESTFVDYSESGKGKVSIVSSTPYARRLYFHPEYHFRKGENPNARGKWYADWIPGGSQADFAIRAYKEIYRRLTGI